LEEPQTCLNIKNAYLSVVEFVLQHLKMIAGPVLLYSLWGGCDDNALIFAQGFFIQNYLLASWCSSIHGNGAF
jgi:hypothetical protein